MYTTAQVNKADSTRLIGEMVDVIETILPEEYELEMSEDKSEIYISNPSNDEVLGALRFTTAEEKAHNAGSEYRLEIFYSGPRDEMSTLWFKAEAAINFLVNQCEGEH